MTTQQGTTDRLIQRAKSAMTMPATPTMAFYLSKPSGRTSTWSTGSKSGSTSTA